VIFAFGCAKKQTGEIMLPYYLDATFTPVWFESDDVPDDLHQIAPFEFTNQEGNLVNNDSLSGKIYVANFFFTVCPSVCPRMTANLERVQNEFTNDGSVLLISHSVMPWVDSVAAIKSYALEKGIKSSKWHLVTGDKSKIYSLARNSYFADEGFGKSVTGESDFLHTENIVLVDPLGHLRGVYNGTIPLEMARLIEDIYRLKKEFT
jgi:protein SCO1/2